MPPAYDNARGYRNEQQKRPPGGALPEGWQFFKPFNSPVWCGIECFIEGKGRGTQQQQQQRGLSVFGLLPMKCPLAPVFDRALQTARLHEDSEEEGSWDSLSTISGRGDERRERLKISERDRTSKARYFQRFPAEAINKFIRSPIFEVKAVMNLCATDRYYDPEDVEASGIQFVKFFFEGGGKTLSPRKAEQLVKLILNTCLQIGMFYPGATLDKLQSIVQGEINSRRPLPVLAIHCTHGVNRTGYCMIMFLFCLGVESVDEGLDIFRSSRGHDVNKTEFEQHLRDVWEYNDPAYDRVRAVRDTYARASAFFHQS